MSDLANDIAEAVPDLVHCLRLALRREPDSWGSDKLHASDLGHALPGEGCLRQLKLRLTGAESREDHDGERWMWRQGHRLQREAFDLMAPVLERQYAGWVAGLWELDLTGFVPGGLASRMDFALLHYPSCRAVVVDCKTRRGGSFAYLDSEGPRPGNEVQVRAYAEGLERWLNRDDARWCVVGSLLLTLDREGQNFARQHFVLRDGVEVGEAVKVLRATAAAEKLPPVLPPRLVRRVNKGPDSLTLKRPWQCDYCPFADVACPSALAPEHRDLGIVGRDLDGAFVPAKDLPEGVEEIVRELLPRPPEVDLEDALRASLEAANA